MAVLSFKDLDRKIDGVDFINVFSEGKTELGKLLSNFAATPFIYKGNTFASVEGYWYYTVSGGEIKFRSLYGLGAKREGKKIEVRCDPPTPKQLKEVYIAKLKANRHILKMLKESKLPLTHYYQYGGPPISADKYLWTVEIWDELRNDLKKHKSKKHK